MIQLVILGVVIGSGLGCLIWLLGLACTALYSSVFKHNQF